MLSLKNGCENVIKVLEIALNNVNNIKLQITSFVKNLFYDL